MPRRRSAALRGRLAWRELVVRSDRGRRFLLPGYDYAFSPEQLWALCTLVDDSAEVGDTVLEVGCAWGATTVYLNNHLSARQRPVDYHCVDTFRGFTSTDIEAERTRGKTERFDDFDLNSRALFVATMQVNGMRDRVIVHQADATTFDYSTIPMLAFALVDIDLYAPMSAAISRVWERLLPGGVLVADDCLGDNKWDGALQAYTEACARYDEPVAVIAGKLGVLRKPT